MITFIFQVVYFTATFPYLILIALLIRGLTLEGHEKGVEFYMTADWDKLKDPKVTHDINLRTHR